MTPRLSASNNKPKNLQTLVIGETRYRAADRNGVTRYKSCIITVSRVGPRLSVALNTAPVIYS